MRGAFVDRGGLFSYISAEARVPKTHPLRKIRKHPVKAAVAVFSEVRSTSCISFLSHRGRDHCGRPFSSGRKTSAGRCSVVAGNWGVASH